MILIQDENWEDVENVELSRLPGVGEPIETKYGKCLVTQVEPLPDSTQYAGKIVCRLPV